MQDRKSLQLITVPSLCAWLHCWELVKRVLMTQR